jgi:hypothetical protein
VPKTGLSAELLEGIGEPALPAIVPVRTLNAAHNPKYVGRAHGATFFNSPTTSSPGRVESSYQVLPRMRPIG